MFFQSINFNFEIIRNLNNFNCEKFLKRDFGALLKFFFFNRNIFKFFEIHSLEKKPYDQFEFQEKII